MQKLFTTIVAALAVSLALAVTMAVWSYNNLMLLDEHATAAWTQVQNQYKRRADIVPSLLSTIARYAPKEGPILRVTAIARTRALSIAASINESNITKEALDRYDVAQGALSAALDHLFVVAERYPDLVEDEAYTRLFSQIETIKSRIASARHEYIATIRRYNLAMRTLPGSVVSKAFTKLEPRYSFSAAESEKVKF